MINNKPHTIKIGPVIEKNSSKLYLENVYINRFCGLPIGVNILPIFAAIVSKETTGIIKSFLSKLTKTFNDNGTNIISATSLVISIEKKKFIKINSLANERTSFTKIKLF